MNAMQGVAVSPGYANGTVVIYEQPLLESVQRGSISPDAVDAECSRFSAAIENAIEEVVVTRTQVAADVGESEAAIFDAHIAILRDPSLLENIENRLKKQLVCAEGALADEIAAFEKRLSSSGSAYMKELAVDAHDVGNRLLRQLCLSGNKSPLSDLPPDSVVVARNLMPSETVGMKRENVSGIATERGGSTSHAAILARSLGIPAVTGLDGIMKLTTTGTKVLLDGVKGALIIDPSDAQRQRFAGRRKEFEQSREYMRQMENKVCRLKGRTRVQLLANINHVSEVGLANEHNLDGIGLFRTELLYLSVSSAPSSATQCRHYKRAAISCGDRPMTIRTFDFSIDKHPSFLSVDATSSLELHGLRFALRQVRLFKSQLRAIVRAAREHPNIRILFPMVTGWWELKEALSILQALSEEEKLKHTIPIGAMIETPAAIFALPEILKMVDFISIGCSDLAQYTLAMERTASRTICECTLHPSLLQAIQQTVETAGKAKCPVSMCGEAASDPLLAAVFVGLGIREFSVSPARTPVVRHALRQLTLQNARRVAESALHSDPSSVLENLMEVVPEDLRTIIGMEHGSKSSVNKVSSTAR
jgi:phosphoenolpyruvate-protein phosphotransferase